MEAVQSLERRREGLLGVGGAERIDSGGGNWGGPSRPGSLPRTPYWLGDSAVRLHALASLIAQAQQLLPQAVHDARDQELT